MPEEVRTPTPENQDEPVRPPIFDQDPFQLAEQMLDGISEKTGRPNDFGPYTFIDDKPIGTGSMAEVWLAQDAAANRRAAIKFFRYASDTEAWAIRETQRLGSLDHQYIARLYTRSAPDDETRWIAMEYVEGAPLDQYCENHHCSIKERLAIFRRVCEAVQYAHSRQVIHGDLKPSNIRVKANGEPKRLDFGLAQQFQNAHTTITQSPPALGFTPAYAAPEQFRGEPIAVSIDVYALGVILYELLSGMLPFDASRCTAAEMKSPAVNERRLELPSIVAGRQGREQLGDADWRDLDAICLKALASTIHERYASVEALIRDIDHYTASEPLDARPHSVPYRLGKFVNRYRRSVVIVSAGLALILCLIGFFTFRLAQERNRALAETARTQRVKQFFLDTFSNATEDALPSEKIEFARIFLDRGVRDIDTLAQDPALQAELYEGFGSMYQDWGDLDRAEQIARRAVEKAQNGSGKDRAARSARAKLTLGNVLEEKGRYAEAIAAANEALGSQIEKADYPAALTLLANAYIHLGDFPRADALNQQAINADRALYGWNSSKVADDLMNLGNIQLSQRAQYRNAETTFKEALAINESVFGRESAQAAESESYVAQSLYFQGGREKEEAAILKHALATLEKTRGEVDQRVAFTVAQMGANALELNDLDGAEKDFLRAAAVYRAIRGDEHQSVAIELANVASVYLQKKEFVRAELAFRDVIHRFMKASLPTDNVNVGIARIKLGHALLRQKRYADAEPELLAGHDAVKKSAPSASWLVKARRDLAEVYEALKQSDKAAAFRVDLGVSAAHPAKH